MPIVILPRSSDDDGAEQAQAKLQAELDDPLAVLCIVSGEGPEVDRAIEVAAARASLRPLTRHVVWVRDVDVLTAAQRKEYAGDGAVAAFVGLDNKVKTRLSKARAQLPLFVERAFTDAEAGA